MKAPEKAWDAEGWLRFLFDWETEWTFPGGLSYDDFKRRFLLAIVPSGWIKTGYGGIEGKRGDIGKGHASFVNLYLKGELKNPKPKALKQYAVESLSATTGRYIFFLEPCTGSNIAFVGSDRPIISEAIDAKFHHDFAQAMKEYHNCVELGKPLFQVRNHWEFMMLVVILENPAHCYSPEDLRKLILSKFGRKISPSTLYKTRTRLGIQDETRYP
jgi:hypothetical protein